LTARTTDSPGKGKTKVRTQVAEKRQEGIREKGGKRRCLLGRRIHRSHYEGQCKKIKRTKDAKKRNDGKEKVGTRGGSPLIQVRNGGLLRKKEALKKEGVGKQTGRDPVRNKRDSSFRGLKGGTHISSHDKI